MIETDGRPTIQIVDPNDNAERWFQYRRSGDTIERRVLAHDGRPFLDSGSPWEALSMHELAQLRAARGQWHPILDPLGM